MFRYFRIESRNNNEINELLSFGKNFHRQLFLKCEILNYQTLIKAYKNMSYKRKRSFKHIWKNLWREKEKKSNISFTRTTLYIKKKKFFQAKFFFRKMFVWVRKSICGWNKYKKNFGGNLKKNLKNFCRRHQKKASHAFSISGNFMFSIFLTKKFFFLCSTIDRILCPNKRKVFWKFDDTILAKCMNFVWLVFFHRLSLHYCMISIFGPWRSTRVITCYELFHIKENFLIII